TPAVEVDLCGHATLASAHVLYETSLLPPEAEARFETRSGTLSARQSDGRIALDFPATPAREHPAPDGLLDALGVRATFVGRTRFDFLVEVATAGEVLSAAPDFLRLRQLPVR